ncbi:MAG TPA: hypothetical protein VFX02_07255 [Gammaproteobacteria bacterium]|nr:hypothetical protein [Gammaproteobacteria bacterium]
MKIQGLFLCSSLLCLAACGGGGGNSGSGDAGDSGSSSSGGSSSSSSGVPARAPEGQIGVLPIELLAEGQTLLVKGRSRSEDDGINFLLPGDGSVSGIKINGESLNLSSGENASALRSGGMFKVQEAGGESQEVFAPLNPGSNTVEITVSDEMGNETVTTTTFVNEGLFGGIDTGNIMPDTAGNRMLIIESSNIYEIDLTTHYRRMLRNPEGDPLWIAGIGAYRSSENQIYYATPSNDPASIVLRRIDLDTGADELISSLGAAAFGEGPVLEEMTGITYDPATDTVYVLGHDPAEADAGLNLIISVNTATGNRAIVSDELAEVGAIAWDSTAGRLLAVTSNSGLFAVDASDGDSTVISQYAPVLVGAGPVYGLSSPSSLVFDPTADRALFVAQGEEDSGYSLFSVDLSNGDRAVISNMKTAGSGPGFFEHGVRGLAVNPLTQKAWAAVDNLYSLLEIDLASGDRGIFSSSIGGGAGLVRPQHGRFDEAGRRLLVVDRLMAALVAVDVDDGNRTVISGAGAGSGTDFDTPVAIDINAAGSVAYVLDVGLDCVFAVDLSNGERTVISGNSVGTGAPLALTFDDDSAVPMIADMVYDEARDRLLITDTETDSLLAVDVESGDRSVAAGDLAEDQPRSFTLEIDRSGNRLYMALVDVVSDNRDLKSRILEMDLATDSVQELIPFADTRQYMYFHDLALSPDGNTLYVMNNGEDQGRQIYVVDIPTRQLIQGTMQQHAFSNQLTTIETGPSNNSVYMFDQMSGAVMLMQVDRVFGSTYFHEYEGAIISQ